MVFFENTLVEQFYTATSFLTGMGSFCLGYFVYHRNKTKPINVLYALLSFHIGMWSSLLFICHLTADVNSALWWNRWLHLFSIFIPITFFHFTLELLQVRKARASLLWVGYVVAFILAFFSFSPLLVQGLEPKFDFRIWPVPGPLYLPFLIFFSFYSYYSLWLIFKVFRKSTGIRRNQLRLIFIGLFIGFSGGATNFAYFYNIPWPPIGNLFVFFYLGFLAYAIIKYRLMDTSLVLVRSGIFLFVYALVLGVPVAIGLKMMGAGPWLLPVIVMGVLATVAPFIYSRFQEQAVNRILGEERRAHNVLQKASQGLTQFKTVENIARSIVDTFSKIMGLQDAAFYLCEQEALVLKSSLPGDVYPLRILFADSMTKEFAQGSLLVDEFVHGDRVAPEFLTFLKRNRISLLTPVIREGRIIGVLLLGEKPAKAMYSDRDLKVLTVIADQMALAIENALYVESLEKTQQQLLESEKMATIGFLVGGLAHQLKNRLTPLVFNSSFAAKKIRDHRDIVFSSQDCDETLSYLEKISSCVQSSKDVINGILNYASDRETKEAVSVKKLVAASIELIEFKVRAGTVIFDNNIADEALAVRGNFAQLQEVIFNIIDNAAYAMMEKRSAGADPDYQPRMTFTASSKGAAVLVTITDNGMGIREENMRRLFTPLFSTKKVDKKGHGLGLYVMKQIVEKNHDGRITFFSQYTQGVTIEILLPAAGAEQSLTRGEGV